MPTATATKPRAVQIGSIVLYVPPLPPVDRNDWKRASMKPIPEPARPAIVFGVNPDGDRVDLRTLGTALDVFLSVPWGVGPAPGCYDFVPDTE